MALLGEKEGSAVDLSLSVVNVLKLFGVGLIAAGTMVIPGVSGSMVLLLLGYYNPIVSAINDFLGALTSFDMNGILTGVGILAPFGIGVVVGVLAIAKVIEIIFNKCPLYAYWAIIGLIVASPIAIIAMGSFPAITVISVVTGILTFALGFFVAMKLGD
jgi:putative membrane protein